MVKPVTKDTELDTRMGIVESDNAPLKIVELPAPCQAITRPASTIR